MGRKIFYTQIGSLPLTSISEAIDYSFMHSIPFLPELPKKSNNEYMLEKINTKGIATELFIERAVVVNSKIIKLQFVGASTLKAYSNEFKIEKYLQILKEKTEYFRSELPETTEILVSLDDPAPIDPSLLSQTISFLKDLNLKNIKYGVHSCADTQWPVVLKSKVDFISFDLEASASSVENMELVDFFSRGGQFFIGALPTDPSYSLEEIQKRLECFIKITKCPSVILTPACGLGLISPDQIDRYRKDLNCLSSLLD